MLLGWANRGSAGCAPFSTGWEPSNSKGEPTPAGRTVYARICEVGHVPMHVERLEEDAHLADAPLPERSVPDPLPESRLQLRGLPLQLEVAVIAAGRGAVEFLVVVPRLARRNQRVVLLEPLLVLLEQISAQLRAVPFALALRLFTFERTGRRRE